MAKSIYIKKGGWLLVEILISMACFLMLMPPVLLLTQQLSLQFHRKNDLAAISRLWPQSISQSATLNSGVHSEQIHTNMATFSKRNITSGELNILIFECHAISGALEASSPADQASWLKEQRSNQSGFSLIEFIGFLGLASLILPILFTSSVQFIRYNATHTLSTLQSIEKLHIQSVINQDLAKKNVISLTPSSLYITDKNNTFIEYSQKNGRVRRTKNNRSYYLSKYLSFESLSVSNIEHVVLRNEHIESITGGQGAAAIENHDSISALTTDTEIITISIDEVPTWCFAI